MRRVGYLDVRCWACGAAPGARCRSLTEASRTVEPHPRRRHLAQEEQERLNPKHVRGQLDLFPAKDARP